MVLERLPTTDIDLKGLKHIDHESHHDPILTRYRLNDLAIARRSEVDSIIAYNFSIRNNVVIDVSPHVSSKNYKKKWPQYTTMKDTRTNNVL